MTSIVPTPAAPVVPQYPALGSANFNQEVYTYGTAMPGVTYRTWEIGQAAQTNATVAQEQAQVAVDAAASAASSVTAAASYATAAATASNVKGAWTSLTGPLSPPATAYHAERYWTLLHPIPDVAASEPGASADWALVSSVTDEILATMQAVALAM